MIVAALAAAAAYAAPLEIAVAVMFGAWLLVPGTVVVPHAPNLLLVDRLVLVAFAVGLIVRVRRGEVPLDALRPTFVLLPLAVFLGVALALGVAWPNPDVPFRASIHLWLSLLDQALLLVVVLAVTRTVGPARVARLIAGLVVITAVIALWERVVGSSWSSLWFHAQRGSDSAVDLATRGGASRARVGAAFSLEYGWVTAILVPLVAAVALYSRRLFVRLAPALVVAAVVGSVSRSPVAGCAVAAMVLVAGVRFDLRLRLALLTGAAVALLLAVFAPSLSAPFSSAGHTNSASIRIDRLPAIMQAVAPRPYLGLGLGGLATRGIPSVDNGYVLLYAELGIFGLLAWLAVLATALRAGLGALRAPSGSLRAIGAACLAGLVILPFAGASYDLTNTSQSTWALWVLAALAVGVSEASPRPVETTRRRWADRALVPVAGFTVGALVLALTPSHSSATYRFESIGPYWVAAANSLQPFSGRVLANSACDIMARAPRPGGVSVDCRRMDLTQPASEGMGEVRIQAGSAEEVRAAEVGILGRAKSVIPGLQTFSLGGIESGRPTWARTAPAWLAVSGLIIALLAPRRRRRQWRFDAAQPAPQRRVVAV
jgi:hypothetical protein